MDLKMTHRKFAKKRIVLRLGDQLMRKLHEKAKPYTLESYVIELIRKDVLTNLEITKS